MYVSHHIRHPMGFQHLEEQAQRYTINMKITNFRRKILSATNKWTATNLSGSCNQPNWQLGTLQLAVRFVTSGRYNQPNFEDVKTTNLILGDVNMPWVYMYFYTSQIYHL